MAVTLRLYPVWGERNSTATDNRQVTVGDSQLLVVTWDCRDSSSSVGISGTISIRACALVLIGTAIILIRLIAILALLELLPLSLFLDLAPGKLLSSLTTELANKHPRVSFTPLPYSLKRSSGLGVRFPLVLRTLCVLSGKTSLCHEFII